MSVRCNAPASVADQRGNRAELGYEENHTIHSSCGGTTWDAHRARCEQLQMPRESELKRFSRNTELGALRQMGWFTLLLLSAQGCTSPLAPSADGLQNDAIFSWVALSDSVSNKIYKGLTKPISLPEQFQCMDRIDMSTRNETDYTVRFDVSCLSRIAAQSSFEFRVTPPHRRLKLDDGRLIVVERGPRVQVLVQRHPDKPASAKKEKAKARADAKMFLKLGKIEKGRRKRVRELIELGLIAPWHD